MAPIKEARRSATVAFSPNASFLAAGSIAGTIDTSFSSASALEVPTTSYFSISH